jgi:tripartite ATP-independent transporter DctM subunit
MSAIIGLGFLCLAILGMPLAFSLGMSAVFALGIGDVDFGVLPQRMMFSVNAFPLMAIPFFMIAGELMVKAGIMERLIDLANAFIGRVHGGLANVTIVSGAGLAAVSGASVADASALATSLVGPLKPIYGIGFSSAIVAAAANLGPIIPPSNAMILYAYLAGSSVSVGALFMAGVVPGLIITVGMMGLCTFISWRRHYPLVGQPISLRNILFQLKRSFVVLLMPIIVMGGIIKGAFTATEGSAIAVAYAVVIGFFITKKLHLADLPGVIVRAATTTAIVGALIAFASTVTFLLTADLLPQRATAFLHGVTTSPVVYTLLVAGLLLVVGMFLESNAAYIMLVPLLHPVALQMGIDPLVFAFVFILNLVIGMLTPPVGVVLFVICGVTGITMGQLFRHLWPFVVLNYAVLFLCIFVPGVVLWFPRLLGY